MGDNSQRDVRYLGIDLYLRERLAEAEEDRRGRSLRRNRSPRVRIGNLLLALGALLSGAGALLAQAGMALKGDPTPV
jgi:hypothetical protein